MKKFINKKSPQILLSSIASYFDDEGNSYNGLSKFEVILDNKFNIPIYIFDNHNYVLYPFLEISQKENKQFEIVHIDAHRDNAKFQHKYPEKITWKNLNWCLANTRVSDYLDLASQTNLIDKIHNITQSWEFQNFKLPKKDFILNLDIDIFGPDGEMVNDDLKKNVIKKSMQNAKAICIATSPGFIDQKKAKKLVLELIN